MSRKQPTDFAPPLDAGWKTVDLARLPGLGGPLPDGSTLFSPQNQHLADVTRQYLYEHPKALLSSKGPTANLTGAIFILMQWMFIRKIFWFRNLTPSDVEEFYRDYMQGLDFAIQATPRVQTVLRQHQHAVQNGTRASKVSRLLSVKEVLAAANLSFTYCTKLKRAVGLAKSYLANPHIDLSVSAEPLARDRNNTTGDPILKFLRGLWSAGAKYADYLTFDPDLSEAREIAGSSGKPKGSTRTMPAAVLTGMLAASIRWVTELAPVLMEALRLSYDVEDAGSPKKQIYVRCVADLNEVLVEAGVNFEIFSKPKAANQISISTACSVGVRVACFNIIAALTARRYAEIMSINADSLIGSDDEGYGIRTNIGKRGMADVTPCPRLAAHAIRLLCALSLIVNRGRKVQDIWGFARKASSRSSPFRAHQINHFALVQGLGRYDDGEGVKVWSFAPHQYRRIFAWIYYWKWDDRNLLALSHQLRHVELAMTRTYVNDAEMHRLLLEEGKVFTAAMVRRIVAAPSSAKGVYGKSLARAVERHAGSMRLVADKNVDAVVTKIMKTRGLTLHPTPWGYCASNVSQSNLRRAACQQEGAHKRINSYDMSPDPQASTEALCATCYFHMTNDSRKEHWEIKLESVRAAVASTASGSRMHAALDGQHQVINRFVTKAFREIEL